MAVETASEETPMRLEGKTALVTGGASGFGAGIVRKFLAEGARVAIADINADAANDFATGLGENAFAVAVDVSRNDSVEAMAESVLDRFGGLDILVNNAGVTHLPAAMEDISEEDFDRVLAVNTKSVYLTARHFVPVMKQKGAGAILNVASTAGVSPRPRLSWYNSSKGWMITATKSMAVELAPPACASTPSTRWRAKRRCSSPSWARTRRKSAPSSSRPFHWAVFDARGHGQCRLFPLFR
jgi:3-oxoacyl-[acyl-carrier protein] reductase